MGYPAPETKLPVETPIPRPAGSLPFLAFQPDISLACSRQAVISQELTANSLGVTVSACRALVRRMSMGSLPSSWAMLSRWDSKAYRGWGARDRAGLRRQAGWCI